MKKKNLLLLGASGTVAHSVLTYLRNHRHLIGSLILLDKSDFKEDRFVSLDHLDASFVKMHLKEKNRGAFMSLLKKKKIDIVLDLSDATTEFMMSMVFEYGDASYVCAAFCNEGSSPLGKALHEWMELQKKLKKTRRPHIFFTGMNPGNVNVWAAIGVKKFGKPTEIIEFEYDTSRFMKHHKEKMVTWCVPEFLVELVSDPSEIVLGNGEIKSFSSNGLFHTEDMEPLLSPILKMPKYPKGAVVSHEECVTLGNRWNIPCRFVYAVNQETMEFLREIYKEKGKVEECDLVIGDNFKDPMVGSDNVGIRLDYKDKAVYYFNSVSNENLKECSGTAFQVTVGVFAALFTLFNDDLKKGGIYYPEDLLEFTFAKFITDNLMVQEFVFKKDEDGTLTLESHVPRIDYGEGEFVKM